MNRYFIAALAVLAFAYQLAGQTPDEMKRSREFETAAIDAYKSNQYADYLAAIRKANENRPNHPRLIFGLAKAFALNGDSDAAFAALERLAAMGLASRIDADDDFRSLKVDGRFDSLLKKFAANRNPTIAGSRAVTIAETGLITEGVGYDESNQTFYVSSVRKRKIIAVDKNGNARDFSSEADGIWGVYGIRVDAKRGRLWASTIASPFINGFKETDRGRSGIILYDLRSGKLLKKYLLPAGGRHALGDLIVDGRGRVFASDSASPVIYTIDPGNDELVEFVRTDSFDSLQGLAFGKDDKTLFVADYSKGIFRIDTVTKAAVQMRPAKNVTLLGIDGLYYFGGQLIAVQNGVNPNRVIAVSVDGDSVKSVRTLEANHPDHLEPTLGVIVGNQFYYVANSQWPLVNEKAELNVEKLRQPVILSIDLKTTLPR
jgi:hypothetical protein